ncbi:MAG: DUF3089 domain-containing protein [Chitinophagaceae bacterium]|nr:DUF3089 domain-containing protein [Chitinophagaceae bacterium]
MKHINIFMLSIVVFAMFSCSRPPQKFEGKEAYQIKTIEGKPDYSNLSFWAAHPYKQDPSDSVPAPLLATYHPDSSVDIFFIHPTTYTSEERSFGWNASLEDAALNGKTDYTSILYQSSIFNEAGRIFAPRYRQAHLSAYFPKTKDDTIQAAQAFELAYLDIKTAFEYYLAHYNGGRPIVIASHSQGSTHAKRLLKEFFDDKPLKSKLVVAYVIGMFLQPDYLSNIPVCKTPSQTGCICSWRTYKNDFKPAFVEKENFNSVVINPLTWDATIPHANRDLNKGGVLVNFNKIVPRVSDATVTDKVLWAGKPHFLGNLFYTTKNYHVADLNLFYLSIRENVQTRITAFRKK